MKLRKLVYIIYIILSICGAVAADETSIALPNEISLKADGYEFNSDMTQMTAEGNVRVARGNDIITADKVDANLMSGDITASGNVTIIHGGDNMTTDKVNANLISGDIAASGNVKFKSPDRSLQGQSFTYNYNTQNGTAFNISGQAGPFYFKGTELKTETGQLTMKKSTFTACDRVKPHYRLIADEIILRPGISLVAKNVSIYIRSMKLFTVPRFKKDFLKDRSSLMSLPKVGYDESGFSIGYKFDLNHGPETDSSIEIMLSSKFGIHGGLSYDRINGHPYFARLTVRELVQENAPRNTVVSRLPEVGIRLNSDVELNEKPVSREPLSLGYQLLDPDARLSGRKHLNVVSELSMGRYVEKPDTNIDTLRADARVILSYDPLKRGSQIVFSPAVFARYSIYKDHGSYGVGGLKLTAGKKIGSESYLSAAYITYSTTGQTPFNFDKIRVKEELVGTLHTNIYGTKIFLTEIYDIKRSSIFDTILVVSRKLHCIESSVTWSGRYRALSFDVKLAGF
ncbi:MAG: hypothetical protein ACYC0V_02480 [Armatimonadota bacterium]